MLNEEMLTTIANELLEASSTRLPIRRPSIRYEGMEVGDAYAVQRIWQNRREAQGHRLVGRKIGLTSRAMQLSSGINEPDYGVIFEDMLLSSGCNLNWNDFLFPRVEAELAFVLKSDLEGEGLTVASVLRATEYLVPALEVLDSRVQLDGRTIIDTISDNAAMGVMILGGNPVSPSNVDPRWVSALLYKNQIIEETGVAAGVLGHPANGVSWLAGKLAGHGEKLRSGDIILAGSFTRPMPVDQGDNVFADYGRLGTITCHFS